MIREATTADAPEIAAIWNWMIAETLLTFTSEVKPLDAVAGIISAREGRFLVSEGDAGIEGFATFGSFRAGPGYVKTCEHSVIVAPAYAGRGIGRRLMEPLLEIARKDGFHVMIAAISSENPGAVAFHKRLGFVQTGWMPEVGFKANRFLDLILMQKRLDRDAS